MRRRAAFYIVLGLTIALLIVALATGVQTHGSTDPNVWIQAHSHVPLLQMMDLAAAFLCVVIGMNGVMVIRLQLQLRHQAEDFGDQMQSLVHRNDELTKVNEEYAEQIAALEVNHATEPTFALGDTGRKVIASLHWQVDAQARQLDSVHRTLEQQHNALQELQQHVQTLEGGVLLAGGPTSPQLAHAFSPAAVPEAADAAPVPDMQEAFQEEEPVGSAEWTGNDGSTLIGEMLEFDVSAFATPAPSPPPGPRPIQRAETRTYPVDESLLAVAAGHLSSIPDPASTPTPEPERVEVSVETASPNPPTAQPAVDHDTPPPRTEAAVAFDLAETALSSLQSETQEALSSLRAQVEATIPQEAGTPGSGAEPEKSSHSARRKPWHRRF